MPTIDQIERTMRGDETKQAVRDRRERWYRKMKAEQPERLRALRKVWVAKWQAKNPRYFHDNHLKRRYGLSFADLQRMFVKQKFRCGICGISIDEVTRHIDHDHKTNHVRGLLCEKCNWGIGLFNDSPAVLRKAIAWLKETAQCPKQQQGKLF